MDNYEIIPNIHKDIVNPSGFIFKGLGSSKTKNLYYLIKLYENFRVFGYNDDN